MIQQWHLRILWPFVFVIVFAFDVFVPLIVISSQNLEVNVVCNKMIAVVEAVCSVASPGGKYFFGIKETMDFVC